MYEAIIYETRGPVAILTLNRPQALNALTRTMLDEIRHAFQRAEDDQNIVGMILTGAGRGFCAGMDMNALNSQANNEGSGEGEADRKLEGRAG